MINLKTGVVIAAVAVVFAAVLMLQACSSGDGGAVAPAAQTDEAVVAEQLAGYPLDTCPVMGAKLGSHGAPYDYVHEGRLVRLCCRGCISRFESDPEQYLSKLDAAEGTHSHH